MTREEKAKKITQKARDFYAEHPGIEEALRTFDLAYGQYDKATQNRHFYTGTSTSGKSNFPVGGVVSVA